jgi:hypothetical protein
MSRVLIAVALAPLVSACGVHCLALCLTTVELTVVDASDSGVLPGSGSVTADSVSHTFDCASGVPSDDGRPVTCSGNVLKLDMGSCCPQQLPVTLTSLDGGASFSGMVSLTYRDTGREVCGGQCKAASGSVQLK